MQGRGIYRDLKLGSTCSCYLVLEGQTICVYPVQLQNEKLTWDISKISSCTFIDPILHIQQSEQVVECSGDLAVEIHKLYLSSVAISTVKPATKKSTILSAIGYTSLLLVTGYLLWFVLMPWLGEKAASLVPISTEVELGEKLSASFAQGFEESDSSSYYLQKIVNALNFDDTYVIKARVLQSDEINAYALPGGNIFVFSAILEKMNSYEELVALLGHELSHIQNRHSLKSMCRSAANSLLLSGLFGGMNGLGSTLLDQAGRIRELSYSRELETEADEKGLEIMLENKVDQKGMLDLLYLLKKESAEMPGLMKYLNTHPDTDQRIHQVRNKLNSAQTFEQHTEIQSAFLRLQAVLVRI